MPLKGAVSEKSEDNMVDELKKALSKYTIEAITKQNFREVFEVYDTNQEFFLLTQGKKATIESSITDIVAMPPNFDVKQKIYISIWIDDKAVGVLDLLKGFPEQSCIWIGLLLIRGELQCRKIGSSVVNAVLSAAKIEGYTSVQIGVIENNIKGIAFWEKHGFKHIRTKENIIVMEKRVV
jgi:ribosomal protein S18 acetylase RimI-like enzyme